MARRRESESSGMDPNSWMMTFSDLMTLLLTFFVLLLSMSSMDSNLLQRFFTIFKGATGPLSFAEKSDVEAVGRMLKELRFAIPLEGSLDDEGLKKLLFEYKPDKWSKYEQLVSDGVEVKKSRRGLRIRFKDRILFRAGGTKLDPEVMPLLDRLAEIIRRSRFRVSVEGHTDDIPVHSKRFKDNWQLSLARAIEVVKYFTEVKDLSANRFRVGGFGSSRPLVPNTSQANRQRNRRIEVFLYRN
ncbi:MAG: flagellar motor protein MotB [Deltaproteobacteria bacterium]|nr:flagellar motor protein MotB [Deltaproteobacteria bacterium]MBW2069723.1 flagellar motor protein MotB [Deltaproteobacteria bacterium]